MQKITKVSELAKLPLDQWPSSKRPSVWQETLFAHSLKNEPMETRAQILEREQLHYDNSKEWFYNELKKPRMDLEADICSYLVYEQIEFDVERYSLPTRLLHVDAQLPTRAHKYDAGLDIYSTEDVVIMGTSQAEIRTGIAVRIPERCVGYLKDRSSMAAKGLQIMGGVIDCGYTGEIIVILRNHNHTVQRIPKGSRIAQLVISECGLLTPLEVFDLEPTERGAGGFGSTGA